jgi:tRNA G37 N-methylase TrmD
MEVPEILLSGDHQAVDRWRHQESCRLTPARRDASTAPNAPDAGEPRTTEPQLTEGQPTEGQPTEGQPNEPDPD